MAFISASKAIAPTAVFGPGSGTSTDNAVVRWDGVTGTLVQDSGVIIDDSNNITGVNSLTVQTIIATTTVTTGDNIIRLNDDVVGAPSENAGIEVERGSSTDATLLWDETTDKWVAGIVGTTYEIARNAAALTTGSIPFADSSGLLAQNNSKLFWDNSNGRLGLGVTAPAHVLHIDAGTATASALMFSAGTTTGQGASDGFHVGITGTGVARIRQHENAAIEFYTNNTARSVLQANGRFTTGDPTESVTFFLNDATRFMANGILSTVSSGLSDIVQIGAIAAFQATPSADTNTGLGVGVYAAQGFNLTLTGSNKFNGGIPVGGYPTPISAIGAFGQVNIITDDTVDGCIGLLCTGGHLGNGATIDDYAAGVFACSTSADYAGGGSLNRATGGFFTVYTDLGSSVNITTARGGWFYEPFIAGGGGTATITNKTAVEVDGTISLKQADDSSTGNIDAYVVSKSYNYMTGAAPVLRGVIPDTFNKKVIFDFANTATISNEHATPTAVRRITTGTGADLTNVKSVCLIYNTTTNRWRVQWWRV